MAKLRDYPIAVDDLREYLAGYSDFSFELQTLKLIRDAGLQCDHGGLYQDSITKKTREFDIRAFVSIGKTSVRLPIECKNVRPNYPILVSRIPRHESESFHEVAYFVHLDSQDIVNVPAFREKVKILRITGADSRYKPGMPVGKNIVQVGRAWEKAGGIVDSDADVFDRWSQCLASANDLVEKTYWEESEREDLPSMAAVIPLLIVPNGHLWAVDYDSAGKLINEPTQIDSTSIFVNMQYSMGSPISEELLVSHLEVLTSNGLQQFINDSLTSATALQVIFPNHAVYAAMQALGIE